MRVVPLAGVRVRQRRRRGGAHCLEVAFGLQRARRKALVLLMLGHADRVRRTQRRVGQRRGGLGLRIGERRWSVRGIVNSSTCLLASSSLPAAGVLVLLRSLSQKRSADSLVICSPHHVPRRAWARRSRRAPAQHIAHVEATPLWPSRCCLAAAAGLCQRRIGLSPPTFRRVPPCCLRRRGTRRRESARVGAPGLMSRRELGLQLAQLVEGSLCALWT